MLSSLKSPASANNFHDILVDKLWPLKSAPGLRFSRLYILLKLDLNWIFLGMNNEYVFSRFGPKMSPTLQLLLPMLAPSWPHNCPLHQYIYIYIYIYCACSSNSSLIGASSYSRRLHSLWQVLLFVLWLILVCSLTVLCSACLLPLYELQYFGYSR